VAKRIVEQAKGEIAFESLPGEGSHFFFTLPASGSMLGAADIKSAGESQRMPPTGLTLLVFLPVPGAGAAIAQLLEPFGNKLTIADSLADAIERGGKQNFDAIIVGAGDADMLAAAPGVHAPLIAVLLRGDRAPAATDTVLRWPLEADPIYRALDAVCVRPDATPQTGAPPAIDAASFSALEKSVGGAAALLELLQCYLLTAEQLMSALSKACNDQQWDDAVRVAQDIVGAAGGVGLAAVTEAARQFARSARMDSDRHGLRNAAQLLWSEHLRAREALMQLYPDIAA
jgi:HPt (histidine-containing phosphotransfer) domain-containing protein